MHTAGAMIATAASAKPGLFGRIAAKLATWNEVQLTRASVEHLDPHLLRDIGLEAPVRASEVKRRIVIG